MSDPSTQILHQQAKNREQSYFELKSGRELHITRSKNNKTKKYAFSILALADKGKKIYQFKKRWLVLGLLSMALMAALPQLQPFMPTILENYFSYILASLFFSALLFFMLLYYTFEQRYVFNSVYTKLPLVEFWVNQPSRKAYQEFITLLENTITEHKQEMHIPYDKQLAGELRTLRRVTEAGILSQSVYLAAKAKLLIMSDIDSRP